MTISELGSIGELMGAMATVATLLYLAFQIRANTQAAKYTSIKDIINSVVGWLSRLGDSEEMMNCWTAGAKSFNDLSTRDQVRFISAATELLAAIEATLETAKSGGIKDESVAAVRAMILQLMRNPGVREYWSAWGQNSFAQDFAREVDVILESALSIDESEPGPLPFYIPIN